MAAEDLLFGSVPADIFRVFAGRSRSFYADLLTHLSEDLFGQSGEVATRSRVVEIIAEHIDRAGRLETFAVAGEDGEPAGPSHLAVYERLLQTGWLVEYRDRYRKVVDFDPAARLVLQALLDIRAGRARSYGGAVLNVLTLLQSVEREPSERALNVREAALAARSFMNHLRSVAGAMRKVEDLILSQPSAAALVRSFVSDFIEATIVRDYRNLQTRESPYRFRGEIVALGERLLEDEARLAAIVEGWLSGGIADEEAAARDGIIADLRATVRTFAVIDDHVAEIETITHRIERRITNVVRFSDRMATVDTERLLATLSAFAAANLDDDAPVDVVQPLAIGAAPLDASHFYLPTRKRADPVERVVEVRPPDPALLRYIEAVDAFQLRVSITPERLAAYVDAALGPEDACAAAAFPVRGLDDFLMFERLHEVGLAPLDRRFVFEEEAGETENDWIARRAFTIRRRLPANG